MGSFDPIAFIETHGVVLASGKGPVPNLAEAVAGEPLRGSWWGHPKGKEIFHALEKVGDSPDILCFKLVGGKITFVHRRLWPALVRLAEELGTERLTAVRQEHTATGAHRNVSTPYPRWVPHEVKTAAQTLSREGAAEFLGPWATTQTLRRTSR